MFIVLAALLGFVVFIEVSVLCLVFGLKLLAPNSLQPKSLQPVVYPLKN